MKLIPDGGPARPTANDDGMSLRDYFAAAALCGYMALPGGCPTPEDAARAAYQHADAMLAARTASKGDRS